LQGGLIKDQIILGPFQSEISIGLFTAWSPRSAGFGGGTQDFFAANPIDGILGLGFTSRNCVPTCHETPMDTFVSDNSLPNMFALCLKAHGVGSQQSSWDIGFIDERKYLGEMHFVPISSDDEYTIGGPSAVRIGGQPVPVEMAQWGEMLVDTGATRMYVPQPVYTALQAIFSSHFADYVEMWSAANGCMVVDCGLKIATQLPPLEMDFADESGAIFTLVLEPHHYVRWLSPTMLCLNIQRSPFSPRDAFHANGVLGDAFQHAFYMVFDKDNHRIGMAPKGDCGSRVTDRGCQDAGASNYDPSAVMDDGSCVYSCTSLHINGIAESCSHIGGGYAIDPEMPIVNGRPHYLGIGGHNSQMHV
jgi:hypothetical protein